jgi:hypothetical protein
MDTRNVPLPPIADIADTYREACAHPMIGNGFVLYLPWTHCRGHPPTRALILEIPPVEILKGKAYRGQTSDSPSVYIRLREHRTRSRHPLGNGFLISTTEGPHVAVPLPFILTGFELKPQRRIDQ